MLELGAIVIICAPDSDFNRARGKVVDYSDRDYVVELIDEELLAFGVDAKERQRKFKRSQLKLFVDYEAGTIVTICAPKSSFDGVQGEIVRWDKENKVYLIKVHPRYDYLIGYCYEEDDKYVRFECDFLEKDDDWSSENKAHLLFGTMWHTLYTCKNKFVPGEECCHQGCRRKVSRRIMFNVWGTVVEEDVCEKHALQYHGHNMDAPFPNKPTKQQAKAV